MEQGMLSLTGYVYEESLEREANNTGQNYWYKYIEEMFDEIGLRAQKLSLREAADQTAIAHLKFIFVGDFRLPAEVSDCLAEWAAAGGMLIGFLTPEADGLFGIRTVEWVKQPDDPFTTAGYYQFSGGAADIDPLYDYRGTALPIFSDLALVEAEDSMKTGTLMNARKRNTGYDAIVQRDRGKGKTVYFAFHLPQTLWVIHQGRPVDRDYDGDGYYRCVDGVVLNRLQDLSIPVADYWLQSLEQMLSRAPQPLIHQLPPLPDGTAPDLLLYCAGDDECTPGIQVKASAYMKERGLGYELNLMPSKEGKFAIDADEYRQIKNNGHDLSLHFDFSNPHRHFTEAELKEQLNQYMAAFGEMPVVTVNHCMIATGWTEQARWASACGIKGDNGRTPSHFPPLNPINVFGFGFGTSYPHFVYDDDKHGNRRLPYAYVPIGFHEPRIYEATRSQDIRKIRQAVDRAVYFRWAMNVFLHPCYISDDRLNQDCLPAIEELVRYLKEKQYRVTHYSTDQLFQWWFDRSETSLQLLDVRQSEQGQTTSLRYAVSTKSATGVLIKIPVPENSSETVAFAIDGTSGDGGLLQQNGRTWAIVRVPSGMSKLDIVLTTR